MARTPEPKLAVPPMTRRSFLVSGLAAGVFSAAGTSAAASRLRTTGAGDCGVASGDPGPDSVVLWTRVPDAYLPSDGSPVEVVWEVATSELFESGTVVQTDTYRATSESDFVVKFRVASLRPFSRYFYRFSTASGYQSVVGRTLTAPASDEDVEEIRFGFVSCENYCAGYYNVFAALCEEDFHFVACVGDHIYEGGGTDVRSDYVGEIDPTQAITLRDYRAKYKLYLSDRNLQEARRLFPWISTWDDHEVFNNYEGGDPDMSADNRDRQRNGYQAFLEYLPVDPSIVLTETDGRPFVRLYRNVSFGSKLDLFAIDGRQHRDPYMCDLEAGFGCDELYAEDRTMLGNEQFEWLQGALRQSTAQWKVVLNDVMMMALKLSNPARPLFRGRRQIETYDGFIINIDQWDGYPAERAAILELIEQEHIQNVVVCTGDVHNCYAGVLRPDFTHPWTPAVAVEIVGGSVTSDGIAEVLGGGDYSDLAMAVLGPPNPHLLYLNAKYHVYTRMVVTSDAIYATYVAVSSVRETQFSVFDLQHLTIPNGRAELIIEDGKQQRHSGSSRRVAP